MAAILSQHIFCRTFKYELMGTGGSLSLDDGLVWWGGGRFSIDDDL